MDEQLEERNAKPAMVINIHSWATPIAGIVMLAVGLFAGYALRPWITSLLQPEAEVEVAEGDNVLTEAAAAAAENNAEELMQFLIDETRHFKGDPDASITMIEFSDFK